MATRMLQRRGTAAEWAAENPILASGEIGFETDTKLMKMGDGVTPWNSLILPYMPTSGGTMTGALSLVAPTADNHGVRRIDLDNKLTGLREILTYFSSGTFVKGNYPWLRAIRVRMVGGGGGGAGTGTASNSSAGGGSGSEYAEMLIPASSLAVSETVTVGSYGAEGAINSDGSVAGSSSFGSHITAVGGNGGQTSGSGGSVAPPATPPAGGMILPGQAGISAPGAGTGAVGGAGGSSLLGGGSRGRTGSGSGDNAFGYGGGGGGGSRVASGGVTGGRGGVGIVLVDLYA